MSLRVVRYDLVVEIETGQYGIEGQAHLHVVNYGAQPAAAMILYLHPELQVVRVRCDGEEMPASDGVVVSDQCTATVRLCSSVQAMTTVRAAASTARPTSRGPRDPEGANARSSIARPLSPATTTRPTVGPRTMLAASASSG